MAIELEKILTISARDWCEMYGKHLSDYEAIGIHYRLKKESDFYNFPQCFAEQIPDEVEVVTDFRFSFSRETPWSVSHDYASGTALIPKEKPKFPKL